MSISDRPQRDAFFQQLRAFVHQREMQRSTISSRPICAPRRCPPPRAASSISAVDLRVGRRLAGSRRTETSRARSSARSAPSRTAGPPPADCRTPGFSRCFEFLADAPAHIEPRQVAHRQRPHRHAEVVRARCSTSSTEAPSSTRNCASRRYGVEHAVADEPAAIPGQHADLLQLSSPAPSTWRSPLCWWLCRARSPAAASHSPG